MIMCVCVCVCVCVQTFKDPMDRKKNNMIMIKDRGVPRHFGARGAHSHLGPLLWGERLVLSACHSSNG